MMSWGGLEQLITEMNSVIYTLQNGKSYQNYIREVKYEYISDQYFENQKKRKYYDIFWTHRFLFMKFPTSSLDDLIN